MSYSHYLSRLSQITIKNLKVYRTRVLLTICGIFFGIVSIIGTFTVSGNLSTMVEEELRRAGAHTILVSPGYGQKSLPLRSDEYLTKFSPAVAKAIKVTPSNFMSFTFQGRTTFSSCVGAEPGYFALKNMALRDGRAFRADDYDSKVAVIGPSLAEKVFGKLNPLGRTLLIGAGPGAMLFRVVGVLEKTGASRFVTSNGNPDDTIYVPYGAYVGSLSNKESYSMIVQARSDEDLPLAVEQTKALFQKLGASGIRISDPRDEVQRNRKLVDGMVYSGIALGILSLLSGGIGIMNIMLVSVMQRKREIGLYKAIGFSDRTVLLQFIAEALAICMSGSIVGILIGVPAGKYLSGFLLQGRGEVHVPAIFLSVAFSLAIGLVFGFLPAKRAADMDPVDALKGQA